MKKSLDSYRVLVLKSEVMMKFIEYYDEGRKKKAHENKIEVVEVATQLLDGSTLKKHNWLKEKIENQLERDPITLSGFTTEMILQKVIEDPWYASNLAKDPTKQNLSEKLQIEFAKGRGIELIKIPGTGPNAIRIIKGKVINGNKTGNASKSVDFLYGDSYVYAKVTTTAGGGQTNQKDDALKFTKAANGYDKIHGDKQFIILLDGDYYKPTILKQFDKYKTKNIRITNSDEL